MKTAISIPDDVFHDADLVAQRLGLSRSQLYTQAVSEFLARQGEDPVTIALNTLADKMGNTAISAAPGRELIDAGAWQW